MNDAREIRAKSLAALVGGRRAGASVKPKNGLMASVRFGWAKNEHRKPEVTIPFVTFDAMGDGEVIDRLRAAWQVPA